MSSARAIGGPAGSTERFWAARYRMEQLRLLVPTRTTVTRSTYEPSAKMRALIARESSGWEHPSGSTSSRSELER